MGCIYNREGCNLGVIDPLCVEEGVCVVDEDEDPSMSCESYESDS